MSKSRRKEILVELKELRKQFDFLKEDIAYKIKLFIRESDLTKKAWCLKYKISYDIFEEDLMSENIDNLKKYLDLIISGKPDIFTQNLDAKKNQIGLSRLVGSLKKKDVNRLWADISYYILMNHKNIQTFCQDMIEKGFKVKYSTFRTDKYNRNLKSAEKYAQIIMDYNNISAE